MWDERYSRPGYAYGTNPNDFLASLVDRLPRGRALCLGEGEGRNAVFLAEHGYDVVALDASAVGMRKAAALARERGVSITTTVADLAGTTIDAASWDLIVSIFVHVPPPLRRRVHRAVVAGLRPGGALVLEAYTPRQLEYRTGGPPTAELMMSKALLEQELAGLDFERLVECEREILEGDYHVGRGAVVQVLARRPHVVCG